MEITDIHTHILPEIPGSALVCIGCGPIPQESGHYFSAGLHPWDVTGNDEDSFRKLEGLIANPHVLAIGECGFDTLKGPSHQIQEQAFIRQVELSERFNKPMILHIVRDFDTPIRLRKTLKPTQPWLIHGFRGNPTQMNQLYNNNILVSFGQNHNKESLTSIHPDHLFLETDGHCPIEEVIILAASERSETPESIKNQILKNHQSFLLQELDHRDMGASVKRR